MMLRQPAHCPYRIDSPTTGGGGQICGLAAELVSDLISQSAFTQPFALTVSPDICQACCQFRAVDLPEMNPVVASLAYRALTDDTHSDPLSVQTKIQRHQRVEFLKNRLKSSDPPAVSPGAVNTSMASDDLKSNWLEYVTRLWQRPSRRLGLMGWNTQYGLGNANRDLQRWLKPERWLVPFKPGRMALQGAQLCEYAPVDASVSHLADRMQGLDAVLFVESPPFPHLAAAARLARVPLVCFPNWEWLRPSQPWLGCVDVMICPTRYTYDLLTRWKDRYHYSWQLEYLPWPIDTDRFAFSPRHHCQRFVSIVGSGGCSARDVDRRYPTVHRKGLQVLLDAARLAPQCQFLIYTSLQPKQLPANVEFRPFVDENEQLYQQGDVCVQCSYWEGCGLPLLESQACGLPLITIDRPPMNEYQPMAVVPVRDEFVGQIDHAQLIPVPWFTAEDLANVLQTFQGKSIAAASRSARQYVLQHHAWRPARAKIWQCIDQCLAQRRT